MSKRGGGMAGQNRRQQQDRKQRKPKEKFVQEREQKINDSPLKAMNPLQARYIDYIKNKSVIVATGFAGTSKTYVPTVMACDAYRARNINYIYITRPAISNSKSLGFFGGDLVEKMSNWLGPVLSVMRERLGQGVLDIAIKRGDIQFIPFEVIKGYSFNDAFVICDEAEDISVDEAKKFLTRIGNNCTAILSGDITQSELKEKSGLKRIVEMIEDYPELEKSTGWVDFDRPSDIVRSETCKEWILAFRRDEIDD